ATRRAPTDAGKPLSSREHLVHSSREVERILGDLVVAAIEDLAADPQGFRETDGRARSFRVRLRDIEWLREEPQQLARVRKYHLVAHRLFLGRIQEEWAKSLPDSRRQLDVIAIRNAILEESRA